MHFDSSFAFLWLFNFSVKLLQKYQCRLSGRVLGCLRCEDPLLREDLLPLQSLESEITRLEGARRRLYYFANSRSCLCVFGFGGTTASKGLFRQDVDYLRLLFDGYSGIRSNDPRACIVGEFPTITRLRLA